MMLRLFGRGVCFAGVLAVSVLLTGCPLRQATWNETFTKTLIPGGELRITNQAGKITVTGTGGTSVDVTATKKVSVWPGLFGWFTDPEDYLDDIDVDVTSQTGEVEVETALPADAFFSSLFRRVSYTVDYEITAPSRLVLDVRNNAGQVTVRDVDGEVDIDQDAGDVNVDGVTGDLTVRCDAGDVDVEHSDTLDADESIRGEVSAGDIEISLPGDSAFDVDASVTAGNIDPGDFDIDVDRTFARADADDSVNGGGADIDLQVSAGRIRFTAL